LTPADAAEARSRGYALLAGLWLEGLTPARLAAVRQTPLAAALPETVDLDELAAAHHTAWTLEVLPYAGVFLDTEDTLGGAAQRLLTDCEAAGFSPKTRDTRADHIGLVLGALSFLSGAEADARQDDRGGVATQLAALQAGLLDRHALSWLPPLWVAGRSVGGFWAAVLELTAELLLSHRGAAGEPWALPTLPVGLLEDRKTSLWRIAGVLASPALSGVFLTRADLGRIGRAAGVPRGFGARQQMLANLLRNAAEYEELPALLGQLDALWAERSAAYAALAEVQPVLSGPVQAWRTQAEAIRVLLSDAVTAVNEKA